MEAFAVKHTISVQQRDGDFHRVALKTKDVHKHDAMKAAWRFSYDVELCDVVVTKGKKHVATYRRGKMIEYLGKAHTP